jgi:N-glycosidase YbiA
MIDRIDFYRTHDRYGEFSNFASYPIEIDGRVWPTSEHYFQAQKFPADPEYQEAIRRERSPMNAAQMGRDRSRPLRADWEQVKDAIMTEAVRAKFTQHPELAELLVGTAEATLVEHTKNDSYWGDGGDGSGKNMLGKILMQLRTEVLQASSRRSPTARRGK